MPLDPNNRFARVPRDVHRQVADAHARLHANRRALAQETDKTKVDALRAKIADDAEVVSHGESWLCWDPSDAGTV